MTTVRELHEKYNLEDAPIQIYLVHKLDPQTKKWKFNGYRCTKCTATFKHLVTIEKHKGLCKGLNKTSRSYGAENPELIITTSGSIWKPLTVNTS